MSDNSPAHPQPDQVDLDDLRPVRLEPGDRVLITMQPGVTHETARRMDELIHKRFPGVEFTFLVAVSGVAVMEPTDT